jgi:O-antigen ligase
VQQFITQAFDHPSVVGVTTLALIGAVVLAFGYLLSRVDVAVILAAGIALELFSGYWSLMGIPIPLDRVVIALAIVVLVLKGARQVSARRLVVRPLHIAFLLAATWALVSAIVAGTLTQHLAFYELLDAFGVVPFAIFTLAPIFFGTARQRNILLATLVGVGFYLGLTGLCEGLHLYQFVFPRYIANANLGIQFGRARGPLLESSSDGFCIFVGGVAAAVALSAWRSPRARAFCYLTIVLDGAAVFFTLTRSVWIGAFVGTVVALWLSPKRRLLVPMLVAGVLVVGTTLAVSSEIRSEVFGRVSSLSPVWDRENTDLAAVRIVKDKPLTGVGWGNFINVSENYMWQQPGYPITGLGIEVHNMFLGNLANLGVPGFLLWFLAFAGAVWRGLLPSRRPQRHDARPRAPAGEDAAWREPWRLGGIAVVLCFVVVANLAPLTEAPANMFLWVWLGVLAVPYTSRLRSARPARSAAPALGGRPAGIRPAYL